ncbi:DAK2 domain-containing protein, partial [Cellulomonas sp. 179-A 9B4 NHS]|uniref:DAK2 domain-containing protein n=1 Tax=Cellulomonas sp. 179-A 9B4 NHS TaxID=3142379 RepID=UPI0039A3A281
LRPRVGRARPLAERSVGTPDPGAVSLAALLASVRGAGAGEAGVVPGAAGAQDASRTDEEGTR